MSRLSSADIVRFGVFELGLRTGELRKRGLRIALQEQPLRILMALLERPGQIVSREELCRRLWPEGTFVDFEHSLNAAVRRLRTTLGDDAEVPRFVETVHKRGYRFLALSPCPSPRQPRCAGDNRAYRAAARAAGSASLRSVRRVYRWVDRGSDDAVDANVPAHHRRHRAHIGRARAARRRQRGRNRARARAPTIWSKARSGATAIACASPRSSSSRRKKHTCGQGRSTVS